MWIGISLDEIERMKESNVKYIQHYYPLVHHRITTAQILQYFKDNNIKEPKRSSCVICPFHSLNYWKALKENAPDDFNKAVEFDDAIRDYPKLNNQTYLSKQLKPLSKFDFNENQLQLFPELIEECDGICGL